MKLLRTRYCQLIRQFLKEFTSRRSLARVLSTFLCSVILVIRPFSALGGSFPFLVLALKELVFSVQANLAQQLELTVLNISGALLGIGFSTLGKYIASLAPRDSASSRATCAVFLIVIAFCAGFFKSRLIRLQLSTRISCFVSVWLLTNNIGIPSRVLPDSGSFLWITLSAAIICLVSLLIIMVLLRWSSTSFETEMAVAFGLLRECLTMSLHHMQTGVETAPSDHSKYQSLQEKLLKQSIKLSETYSQAAFELRIGRLNLKTIRPLIGTVEHLRRELAWGMSPLVTPSKSLSLRKKGRGAIPDICITPHHAIGEQGVSLCQAIVRSIEAMEHLITVAFRQSRPSPNSATPTHFPEKMAISQAASALVAARSQMKEAFGGLDAQQQNTGERAKLADEVLGHSLIIVALLQMAQEMQIALELAQRITALYEDSQPRLWLPHFSLSWLGVPPGPHITDEDGIPLQISGVSSGNDDPNTGEPDPEANLSYGEAREALAERGFALNLGRPHVGVRFTRTAKVSPESKKWRISCSWSSLGDMIVMLWALPAVLRLRIQLSKVYRAMHHSNHVRHALKNAIGVTILTFPAFMPANSAGSKWFADVHGEWMTISYLWVLETNTGATWRIGYLRLLGTLLGAIYAYITGLICKTNPYGLVALVTLSDVPITWIALKTSVAPMAAPAAVAIPPIVFAQYFAPDTSGTVLHLAILRAWMISMGIIAAFLMNSLVFPRHCRVMFLSDTSRTLGLLSNLYLTLSHNMFRRQQFYAQDEKRKTLKLELRIRSALHRLSALIVEMNHEVSLLPKPLSHYRETVTIMQKLLDLMTGLRQIREKIPRKETVNSVFHERQEFMSCVCISIFACQHAFRAREPLPQFLPSARHAFANLRRQIQECIGRARSKDPHRMGLSLVYAFAEQEVMEGMVNTLEELLELSGQLFGTSAWLTQDPKSSVQEEGDRGWYSTFKWEET